MFAADCISDPFHWYIVYGGSASNSALTISFAKDTSEVLSYPYFHLWAAFDFKRISWFGVSPTFECIQPTVSWWDCPLTRIIPISGHQSNTGWMSTYRRVLWAYCTFVNVKRLRTACSCADKWRFDKNDPLCSVTLSKVIFLLIWKF